MDEVPKYNVTTGPEGEFIIVIPHESREKVFAILGDVQRRALRKIAGKPDPFADIRI